MIDSLPIPLHEISTLSAGLNSFLSRILKALSEKISQIGVGLLNSLPHVNTTSPRQPLPHPQTYEVNFRENNFIQNMTKKLTDRREIVNQIKFDEGRMLGLINGCKLLEIIDAEQDPDIRQNIVFACTQKFEGAVALLGPELFPNEDKAYLQIQQAGDSLTFSTCLYCDHGKRASTLITRNKAIRFSEDGKNMTPIETFQITANMNWDTAQVTISKQKIEETVS